MKDFISPEIRSYTSEEILEMIGPAETQYGPQYTLTLGLEGEQGALACGSTITDNDANDTNSAAGTVGYSLVWNDLPVETGYRYQYDTGATFVAEDVGVELAANSTSAVASIGGSNTITFRVFGHVGHAPGHGGTPIAGDVVSNVCSVTTVVP